jgi:hypothetical protein
VSDRLFAVVVLLRRLPSIKLYYQRPTIPFRLSKLPLTVFYASLFSDARSINRRFDRRPKLPRTTHAAVPPTEKREVPDLKKTPATEQFTWSRENPQFLHQYRFWSVGKTDNVVLSGSSMGGHLSNVTRIRLGPLHTSRDASPAALSFSFRVCRPVAPTQINYSRVHVHGQNLL